MSTFQVAFTKIKELNPHPNPEVHSLEIATVYGFNVVVRKGSYNVGDFALYIPIDSVLPQKLTDLILGPNPKIKLHQNRVKQIRIQKFPSQGMLISVEDVKRFHPKTDLKLEVDLKETLNINKYEPPVPEFQKVGEPGKKRNKPLTNSNFHQYNGLENVKWYPDLFEEGELVVIQEKLHGSNCRAGIVPTQANTLLKKIKKLLGFLPKYEYVYGSNQVELTNKKGSPGYYGKDVYSAVLEKVGAEKKLKQGEQIFGELIGEGIQKNYTYGHKEHHFVLFDVKELQEDGTWKWLTPTEVSIFAKDRGFDMVPVLYEGPYNKHATYELTKGDSVYCPSQKIREGVVIKSDDVAYNKMGMPNSRKSLKWISEAYLDKDNTDFH